MLGMESVAQVKDCLKFEVLSERDKDYSFIFAEEAKLAMQGRCMYCNHCLPCIAHINIAQVNKFLDMALLEGPISSTVKAHYETLDHKADECVACGICESNCPFGVEIIERMKKAVAVFS